jgi:hypothetical protein
MLQHSQEMPPGEAALILVEIGMPSKQTVQAAHAVLNRLLQMRQLWDEAASSYFHPSRFQLSLQNCITVSRTVSFILQANKSSIEGFNEWYSPIQDSWKADRIMVWVKEARNVIEKQGDLATCSQVRARIVASYVGGPETAWMPQHIFSSPHDIWASVPKRFLIPHVVEHGTLVIERRWVDSELPDMEVLEALAHVYCRLADMVASLLKHTNLPVPPLVAAGRPEAMGALAMDRAIYLSMRDGSPSGFRYFYKNIGIGRSEKRKIKARYGKAANWECLRSAKNFREITECYFQHARMILIRDGYHRHFTFFLRGSRVIRIIETDHPDRASRYVLMRDLAQLAKIDGADGVMVIGEAWTAKVEDLPPSGFAVEAKERGEMLVLNAANSNGEAFVLETIFFRRKKSQKKVKKIGKTEFVDEGFQFMLYPFMKEWDCVNEERFKAAITQMDEMGIETPTAPPAITPSS